MSQMAQDTRAEGSRSATHYASEPGRMALLSRGGHDYSLVFLLPSIWRWVSRCERVYDQTRRWTGDVLMMRRSEQQEPGKRGSVYGRGQVSDSPKKLWGRSNVMDQKQLQAYIGKLLDPCRPSPQLPYALCILLSGQTTHNLHRPRTGARGPRIELSVAREGDEVFTTCGNSAFQDQGELHRA